MKFAEENRTFLLEQYENGASTYSIANALGTYANKVNRALKYLGAGVRNKSEAQRLALETGRHEHPTKGKKRSEETRVKISEAVYNYWQDMPDDERERRSQQAQDQWDKMTDEQRENLRLAAAAGVREAAKEGSKMEKFLKEKLEEHGYNVLFHKKGLILNSDLELDLYVTDLNVAIEIDGPAHFFPIWGQDSLNRNIKSDNEKSGLILAAGMCIIRVKHLTKSLTEKHKRDVLEAILEQLGKIEKKFPPKNKRYIELEVD